MCNRCVLNFSNFDETLSDFARAQTDILKYSLTLARGGLPRRGRRGESLFEKSLDLKAVPWSIPNRTNHRFLLHQDIHSDLLNVCWWSRNLWLVLFGITHGTAFKCKLFSNRLPPLLPFPERSPRVIMLKNISGCQSSLLQNLIRNFFNAHLLHTRPSRNKRGDACLSFEAFLFRRSKWIARWSRNVWLILSLFPRHCSQRSIRLLIINSFLFPILFAFLVRVISYFDFEVYNFSCPFQFLNGSHF